MNKNGKNKGFTLTELIIAMLCALIVMGGVITSLKLGLDLFEKERAVAGVTNGLRFTAASYKQQIQPMLNSTGYIEVLREIPSDPLKRTSEDCYLYLDEDTKTVMLMIGETKSPLNGSEYITSLSFTLPVSMEVTSSANFLLKMYLKGEYSASNPATIETLVETALFNFPNKRDSYTADNITYKGPVLHFTTFRFENLTVLDLTNGAKTVANNEAVEKGNTLQTKYDITIPSGKQDATKILWYLSTKASSTLPKSTPYWPGDKAYTGTDSTFSATDDKCWPMLIKSDDKYYLANDQFMKHDKIPGNTLLEIPTAGDVTKSGTLYYYNGDKLYGTNSDFNEDGTLKTEKLSKALPYGQYAFLRPWVVPAYSDKDGSQLVQPAGYDGRWGARVRLANSSRLGELLFNTWVQDMAERTESSYKPSDEFWYQSEGNKDYAVGKVNTITGEYTATITSPKDSNAPAIATVLAPNYFGDARMVEMRVNDKSYTSMTNYSIIIDAEAGNTTAGISLLLNGYRQIGNGSTSTAYQPSGFAIYYDPAAIGYPVRLIRNGSNVNGYNANGVDEIESPLKANMGNSKYVNNFYNPQYVNVALQNDLYKRYETETNKIADKGENSTECKEMQSRRRYMITILEYYGKKKKKPSLLVRLRLLKNLDEVLSETALSEKQLRAEDPFLCGPKFYLSEPAWYGDFLGQQPKKETSGNSWWNKKDIYSFNAMRSTTDKAALSFKRTVDSGSTSYTANDYYYASLTPNYKYKVSRWKDGGVYEGKALSPRNEGVMPDDSGAAPDRFRWIGIGLWRGYLDKSHAATATFYGMTVAPGFDADELRSITRNNAKLYGMNEIIGNMDTSFAYYNKNNDTAETWNKEIFGSAKASDGKGNRSTGNSYKDRFTDASGNKATSVMSLQHTAAAGKYCYCPICTSYANFNKKINNKIVSQSD